MKFRKLVSLVLCVVFLSIPINLQVTAASYTSDYRYWSQGASSNSLMQSYGCWVVAQAKLIYESGINTSNSFNPDVLMNWELNNGYLNSGFYQTNGGYAPVAYAETVGKKLNYLGSTTSSTENKIWENISNGYFSIIRVITSGGSEHYVMVANSLSSSNGQLYCYNSYSNTSSAAPSSIAARNYQSITRVYTYSIDNSSGTHTHDYTIYEFEAAHPHKYYKKCSCGDSYYTGETTYWSNCSICNSTVTITSYSEKNTITDTNAILWGIVYKPSSYSVTKIGIRVRQDGSSYTNGWSKFEAPSRSYVGETSMCPYYNLNTELGLTLTHATKYWFQFYAQVNGTDYWSDEYYITTTGSHSYPSSWTTTKAATCTSDGTAQRKCTGCSKTKTKTISKLGHNYSTDWTVDKEATCAETGSKSRHCTRCDAKTDITEISAKEHSSISYGWCNAPTEESNGLLRKYCFDCDSTIKTYDMPYMTIENVIFTNNTIECRILTPEIDDELPHFVAPMVDDAGTSERIEGKYTIYSIEHNNLPNYTSEIQIDLYFGVGEIPYSLTILETKKYFLHEISNDINGDNLHNAVDLALLKNKLLATSEITTGDANADGNIDLRDLIHLKKYIVNQS